MKLRTYLPFLRRHPIQLILDRLQFIRDLIEVRLLMFELFPELLVFAFLSLPAFFGCERGRIGQSSRSAGRYPVGKMSMLVPLTLMELSFETVNPFFGLIDDVFLKGTVRRRTRHNTDQQREGKTRERT